MSPDEVKNLFDNYSSEYDIELHRQVWAEHKNTFLQFWKVKIISGESTSPESDYDPIIKLIDVRARGFNREVDEAVARVNLPQGVWYRIFNDLRDKKDIQNIVDKILNSTDEEQLVELINELNHANEKNKNGLTGQKAAALNALMFLGNPDKYLSCVSLSDRDQIIERFVLPSSAPYQSYGESVVLSNREIINGFIAAYKITAWPRQLSNFLYSDPVQYLWKGVKEADQVTEEIVTSEALSHFGLEKHLEDFLIANWESTELGKKYDLIEENGELVSQQYMTPIGRIDLLVRDKSKKSYMVIELKRSQTSDDTVGQLTRYMGWVQEKWPENGPIKGIIIALHEDERLRYALKAIPNAEFFVYKISFSLEKK